tara:strand:- start:2964 stop:4256 length:1293 start_codon:yes stop_codon:yes gene_type:complete
MSLKDKACLIFKPSRVKSGKAYSFRGEDFTFTRSGIATRYNEQGKIEEVAGGIPRLNYDPADLTKCPHLLLEDSRTNRISNGMSLGSLNKTSVLTIDDQESPDALPGKGVKLNVNTSTGAASYLNSAFGVSSGDQYTVSIYAKAGEFMSFNFHHYGSAGIKVNLQTGKVVHNAGDTTYGTKYVGNGWYRVWMTWTSSQTSSDAVYISPTRIPTDNYASTTSTIGEGIYIYGLQAEEGPIPTSLIKTTGSLASRSLENMNITTLSNIFPQTKATFMIDFSTDDDTSLDSIVIRSSASNYGRAYFYENKFGFADSWGGESITGANSIANSKKTKFIWRLNDDSNGTFFLNGKESNSVSTTTHSWNNIHRIDFMPQGGTMMIDEMYFSADALSSAECIALTSYDDYQELVDRNDLTWESPTITNNRLTALKEL